MADIAATPHFLRAHAELAGLPLRTGRYGYRVAGEHYAVADGETVAEYGRSLIALDAELSAAQFAHRKAYELAHAAASAELRARTQAAACRHGCLGSVDDQIDAALASGSAEDAANADAGVRDAWAQVDGVERRYVTECPTWLHERSRRRATRAERRQMRVSGCDLAAGA